MDKLVGSIEAGKLANLVITAYRSVCAMRRSLHTARRSLHTAQIAPYSVQIASYSAQVASYSAQVAPCSAQITPYSAQIAPYNAQIGLCNAQIAPYGIQTSLCSAQTAPYGTQIGLCNAQIAPYSFLTGIWTYGGAREKHRRLCSTITGIVQLLTGTPWPEKIMGKMERRSDRETIGRFASPIHSPIYWQIELIRVKSLRFYRRDLFLMSLAKHPAMTSETEFEVEAVEGSQDIYGLIGRLKEPILCALHIRVRAFQAEIQF